MIAFPQIAPGPAFRSCQRLRAHTAPRRVKRCGRSNINEDDKVQLAAEDEDEDKQQQQWRMGIDNEDIRNGCRYVVSYASPSPHACLVLIVSAHPSFDLRALDCSRSCPQHHARLQ